MRRCNSCPLISLRAELAPYEASMAMGQLSVVLDKAGWERPASPVKAMTNCYFDNYAPTPDLLQPALASPPSTTSPEDALKDLPLATSRVVTGVGQPVAADLVVNASDVEDASLGLLPGQLCSIALDPEPQVPAQPQPSVVATRPINPGRSKRSCPRWGNRRPQGSFVCRHKCRWAHWLAAAATANHHPPALVQDWRTRRRPLALRCCKRLRG
jgi:hypothetical protein